MSRRSRQQESRPPEFFIDRNLGANVVPKALEETGLVVHRMADLYGDHLAEQDDATWIREVTGKGWVILSKDKRIRRNAIEKAAVVDVGARLFCLSTGELTGRQQAERFVHHGARMIQRCTKDGPFIYLVHADRLERLDLR